MSMDKIKEGLDYLGITDQSEIDSILNAKIENDLWEEEQEEVDKGRKRWEDRYKVPIGLKKKEYEQLKKETQEIIDDYKKRFQDPTNNEITKAFIESGKEPWIEKKEKIKKFLKHGKNFSNNQDKLKRAKEYPIDQLIEIGYSGFAKRCYWHSPDKDQETPSLKYYKKSNNLYCFACSVKKDSIDLYCTLYKVDINEAINKLQ